MKRSIYLLVALFGLLTSLIVMAISFLANLVFSLPFLPFDLFEGLTRLLPGKIVDTAIHTMVTVITALHLGQVDTTAKLAEQIQGLGLVLITGIVWGLLLAWVSQKRPAWLRRFSYGAGFVLWVGMVFLETALPQNSVSFLTGLVWLLALIMGWAWVLYRITTNLTKEVITLVPPEKIPGYYRCQEWSPGGIF